MGRYDAEIESAKRMLAEAQRGYESALVNMASAAPNVRDFVLSQRLGEVEEARRILDTFQSANN